MEQPGGLALDLGPELGPVGGGQPVHPRDQAGPVLVDGQSGQTVGHRVADGSDRDQLAEQHVDQRAAGQGDGRAALAEFGLDRMGPAGQRSGQPVLGQPQPQVGPGRGHPVPRRPAGDGPALGIRHSLFDDAPQATSEVGVDPGTGTAGESQPVEEGPTGQGVPASELGPGTGSRPFCTEAHRFGHRGHPAHPGHLGHLARPGRSGWCWRLGLRGLRSSIDFHHRHGRHCGVGVYHGAPRSGAPVASGSS